MSKKLELLSYNAQRDLKMMQIYGYSYFACGIRMNKYTGYAAKCEYTGNSGMRKNGKRGKYEQILTKI